MKAKFAKLIDVKSIVTIVLLAVFAYLSIIQSVDTDNFISIFMMIIAFYFGTQTEKNKAGEQ